LDFAAEEDRRFGGMEIQRESLPDCVKEGRFWRDGDRNDENLIFGSDDDLER